MADNDTFIPTYETCDEVSDRCPVEATIYGTNLSYGAAVFFAISFLLFCLIQIWVSSCRIGLKSISQLPFILLPFYVGCTAASTPPWIRSLFYQDGYT